MTSAVQNYANYLKSENAWMLGRFIVSDFERLDEFCFEAENFQENHLWRLT